MKPAEREVKEVREELNKVNEKYVGYKDTKANLRELYRKETRPRVVAETVKNSCAKAEENGYENRSRRREIVRKGFETVPRNERASGVPTPVSGGANEALGRSFAEQVCKRVKVEAVGELRGAIGGGGQLVGMIGSAPQDVIKDWVTVEVGLIDKPEIEDEDYTTHITDEEKEKIRERYNDLDDGELAKSLQNKIEEIEPKIRKLERKKEELNDELEDSEKERDEVREKINGFESEIEELTELENELNGEIETLAEKYRAIDTGYRGIREPGEETDKEPEVQARRNREREKRYRGEPEDAVRTE